MNKLLLLFTFMIISTYSVAQEIQDALEQYLVAMDIEKVYVSLDKPYYIPDDVIWGKIYVVDGSTHQLIEEEPIVHLDWINPEGNIKNSYLIKIKNGVGTFDIQTNSYDQIGAYTIRAYTQYQLNFDHEYIFQKEVSLINSQDYLQEVKDTLIDHTMHFFPEGGYLIAGLQNSVAFKMESDDEKSIPINGKIIDEHGKFITDCKSWNESMGKFEITPKAGHSYWAEVNIDGQTIQYQLPKSLPTGYVLKVNNVSDDKIYIDIKSNTKYGLKDAQLLVHIRGQLVSDYKFRNEQQSLVVLEKSKIPSGIIHLTLFDNQNRPVAERLVFNKNKNEKIDIQIDIEKNISKENIVSGSIGIDGKNAIKKTSASIAIYNVDVLSENLRGLDIENYFLLQSDVHGMINDPSQYFEHDDNRTRGLLDLLLMTQAWRRFSWQSVLAQEIFIPETPKELSTTITGRILQKNTDKALISDVGLSILKEDIFATYQHTTEDDGIFLFTGIDLPDSTDIMLQAVKHHPKKSRKLKKGELRLVGNKNVDIEIFDMSALDFDSSLTHYNSSFEPDNIIDLSEKSDQSLEQRKDLSVKNSALILNESSWSIDIDEVVIQQRKFSNDAKNESVKKRYKEKDIFYMYNSEKFLADDPQYEGFYYANIHEMLQRMIPDAQVTRVNGIPRISLGRRSDNNITRIVVDGILIDPEREIAIQPETIYSVDVQKSLTLVARYDVGQVISLLTREPGEYKIETSGVRTIKHPGYYTAREFYNPIYSKAEDNPDYRTTIYWDPALPLNDQGMTLFKFRTSNLSGRHLIFVEGLTEFGLPFTARKYFTVRD